MDIKKTERGFAIAEFLDTNGVKCSIQKSSSAEDDKIWLGANEIGLKEFKAGEGWKDVDLSPTLTHHFVASNRMHLDRETVEKILPILQGFVATGEVYDPSEKVEEPLDLPTEKIYLVEAMETFGGSFVVALADALRKADHQNTQKILATWPEYVDQYMKWAVDIKSNRHQDEV